MPTLSDTSEWALFIFCAEWVIKLVMLPIITLRRTPQSATAWLAIIYFLPWVGVPLFLLIGQTKVSAWRREQLDKYIAAASELAEKLNASAEAIPEDVEEKYEQALNLVRNLGRFRVLGGNQVELIDDYLTSINHLVDDINAAEHHVHLLFYIFSNDAVAMQVVQALERAVQRGVECRVLIDSFGSQPYIKDLKRTFEQARVEFDEALPRRLISRRPARLDMRNHRKIAVIDGKIGYTGSQNIVDPCFKKGITYEDMMVRVRGPLVLQFQFVFSGDWYLETDNLLMHENYFPNPERTGNVIGQLLPSGPAYDLENNQRLLVSLIHQAKERVVLTTPYFVPDEALIQAMQTAILRGVHVHLVISAKLDQVLVSLAQESYYEALLQAGVIIHMYESAFLHAKHVSIDDDICIIGSSNMDIRSFVLNEEISLVCYDRDLTSHLNAQQDRYFLHSKTLSLEEWKQRRFLKRFAQSVARLMSPLL